MSRDPEAPSRVSVQNAVRCRRADLEGFDEWLEKLTAALAPGEAALAVRLIGDPEMRRLNRTYRTRDRTTDVLSFPGQTGEEERHLGDVAISVPAARRQARVAGYPVGRELRRLALHAVLHCLGYDHESDDGEMQRIERELAPRWIGDAV